MSALGLLRLSDGIFERTRHRLDGLTDDEYLWEPVSGCWSVRQGGDGIARADWQPNPDPPPFTTIAWRLWHLTKCYGEARNQRWLLGTDDGAEEDRCAPRATAEEALLALRVAHQWWRLILTSMADEDWAEPLGAVAGHYGRADKTEFVLHMVDEFSHHGAEVALLRDLYAAGAASDR